MDWIQGNKFQKIADWTYSPPNKAPCDYAMFNNTLEMDKLKDGDIIYVQGFHYYKQGLLDLLKNTDKRVKIISHNCDEGVDDRYSIPENVTWFAQNVGIIHERVKPIPIGIDNDIMDFGIHKKRKMLDKLKEKREIRNMVYIDHSLAWNYEERIKPYNFLRDKEWATVKEHNGPAYDLFDMASLKKRNKKTHKLQVLSYDTYLDNIYNHKFAICPEGNGITTYRPFEAMYVGTIPIERRNTANYIFEKEHPLPICFVDLWEQLTEEFLNREYERIKNKFYNYKILTFKYWEDICKS